MNYSILGWTSLSLLAIQLLPFVMRQAETLLWKRSAPKAYKATIQNLRRIHKPLGLLLLIVPPIHGFMALGGLRLHTGSLLYIGVLCTGVLGGGFYRLKHKSWLIWHRRVAVATFGLFLVHFLWPGMI